MQRALYYRQLGARVAPFLGHKPDRTTYNLRRLCLRGLIARTPGPRPYRVTQRGLASAPCIDRTYDRLSRFHSKSTAPTLCPSKKPLHESTARSIDSGRAARSPYDLDSTVEASARQVV